MFFSSFRLQDPALAKEPCYVHRELGECPLRGAAHCCTCGCYDGCRCTKEMMAAAAVWYASKGRGAA
jgi:hypothetical protein